MLDSLVELDTDTWEQMTREHAPDPAVAWSCDPGPGECRRKATADIEACNELGGAWIEKYGLGADSPDPADQGPPPRLLLARRL